MISGVIGGDLENVLQASSPKYDAVMNFMSNNPCWWSGCSAMSSGSARVSNMGPHPLPTSGSSMLGGASGSSANTNPPFLPTSTTAPTGNTATAPSNTMPTGNSATALPGTQTNVTSVATPVVVNVTVNSPENGPTIRGYGSVNIAVSAVGGTIKSLAITTDGNTLAMCSNASSCSATWQGRRYVREHILSAVTRQTRWDLLVAQLSQLRP